VADVEKRKGPTGSIIREGDEPNARCLKCGSSFKFQFKFLGIRFGKRLGCRQPECSEYYNKTI